METADDKLDVIRRFMAATNPTEFDYKRQMSVFVALAVGGWIGYLLVFRHFFPNDYDPAASRGVFWAWAVGGTLVFVGILLGTFRIFRTPAAWKPSGAIAGVAPAMILDSLATAFYRDWFSSAGVHEASAYSATILMGAGSMLLVAFALWRPSSVRSG